MRSFGFARVSRPKPPSAVPLCRGKVRLVLTAVALIAVLGVTGCSAEAVEHWKRGGYLEPVTDQGHTMADLWRGSWIAALIVGFLVWGLILWSVIFFRRRGRVELPPQVRYNVPIEALYTIVPVVAILVFFYFTARDEAEITKLEGDATVHINVVAKRWSWDFNYTDAGVFQSGTPGIPPTLYLPVDQKVEFTLTSRDVIHSFWVPAFLFKMDVVPGRVNKFELTPEKEGTYAGKCAELCGVDHSRMLFNVAVVSEDEYERHLAELKLAGTTGQLPAQLGPNQDTGDLPAQSEGESGT